MRRIVSNGDLEAVALDTVRAVERKEWDTLAAGAFYPGFDWAVYQERDPGSVAWVVAVVERGRLLAAATCYRVVDEASPAYDVAAQLGGRHQPRATLLCGNRRGHDNRLLVVPDREDALALLVRALREEARTADCAAAFWLYLDDPSVTHLAPHLGLAAPWLLGCR